MNPLSKERMTPAGKKIYILLPAHNRKDITAGFVRCLKAQGHGNWHLVLIDDGSRDGTAEMVLSEVENSTVIRGKGDWWWAGSLHQGFKWLKREAVRKEDVVLIMNDDTEFRPDFLEKGVAILRGHSRTLLLARSFSLSSGDLLDAGVHTDWRRFRFEKAERPEDVNCLSTMGLFLRVKDFLDIGGFHPRLLPHFTSDYEFTMRAYHKGFALITDPALRLWLNEETTWNKEDKGAPFGPFLRTLFSKKSPVNPLVWTFFIALACPWRWKLLNWYRVWMGTTVLVATRAAKDIAGRRHLAESMRGRAGR